MITNKKQVIPARYIRLITCEEMMHAEYKFKIIRYLYDTEKLNLKLFISPQWFCF